jgi:hypothetical protein
MEPTKAPVAYLKKKTISSDKKKKPNFLERV